MRNKDRALGAYFGAAIGDAMGGPVEFNHYARIKRLVGEVKGLMPYAKPYTLEEPRPGYAHHKDPGCVTDDTFIRWDITRFYLETKGPRTPQMLADWCLRNAHINGDFPLWDPPLIEALRRVERGEVKAEEGGMTFTQGGGVGWWTPVGILNQGNPEAAAEETKKMSSIWKAPLEKDLISAVQAGVADAGREGATMDSVINAMFKVCGPLPQALMHRAIDIARQSKDIWNLAAKLYQHCLMPEFELRTREEPPRFTTSSIPPVRVPLPDSDGLYASWFLAEQVPFALAAFVYGRGELEAIPICCTLGRDADTTSTTVGSWVGALHGESGLPKEWVDAVCEVNIREIDIRGLGEQLAVHQE